MIAKIREKQIFAILSEINFPWYTHLVFAWMYALFQFFLGINILSVGMTEKKNY